MMSTDSKAKDSETLQNKKELTNEELNEVAGGRGQFTEVVIRGSDCFRVTSFCEMAGGNQTLQLRYHGIYKNCGYYEWNGSGSNDGACARCTNFIYDWEVEYVGQVK